MRRSSSRAICTRVLGSGAAQPAGDALLPAAVDQRPFGDLELGPEVMQPPAQVVDQRGALSDQPLAMVSEVTDLKRALIQLRERKRV
jgi:hypothetical protein